MFAIRYPTTRRRAKSGLIISLLAAFALLLASCSSGGQPAASSSVPSTASASPSPAPNPAADVLTQAASAARAMKTYAFDMQLIQHLKGAGEGGNSDARVDMQGHAELGPLKLDQTIKNDLDGQTTSVRTILLPDAYYMYDPEFTEWSRSSPKEAADMAKTLSDFQTDPAKSLERIRVLGVGLKLEQGKDANTIRYTGSGPEAKSFLDSILESTLDLSGMEARVRQSIKLQKLSVTLTLDPDKHLPSSYRVESLMSVEYEAGKPATLDQTLAGTYRNINASSPVVVPDEAKNAPLIEPPPNNAA